MGKVVILVEKNRGEVGSENEMPNHNGRVCFVTWLVLGCTTMPRMSKDDSVQRKFVVNSDLHFS